jgi:hypothetical protein
MPLHGGSTASSDSSTRSHPGWLRPKLTRAREIIEEFPPGSATVSRLTFAVMVPLTSTAQLVWLARHRRDGIVDLGADTGIKKPTSEARTGSEADRNPTQSAWNITKRFALVGRLTDALAGHKCSY